MKPRVCVPLPASSISELASLIVRAERAGADLIEVRLDYMGIDNVALIDEFEGIIKQASVPLIATNRQHEQGGHGRQNEELRVQTLIRAAEAGFQYVDLELTTADVEVTVQKVRACGAKPIVSFHDLEHTPSEPVMKKIVRSQIALGAEICKLVTTADDVKDNLRCLSVTRQMSEATRVVCFAIGPKGLLSRVLSPIFGAYFTFASLKEELETATGQISIAELKELYRRLGVTE